MQRENIIIRNYLLVIISYPQILQKSVTPFITHPLRTFLALLGIIFGVSAVVAMVSIGEGAQNDILNGINAMGATLLRIEGNPIEKGQLPQFINKSRGLSRNDLIILYNYLEGIDETKIAYYKKLKNIFKLSFTNDPTQVDVLGVNESFINIMKQDINSGRSFNPYDFDRSQSVIIIGSEIAKRIIPENSKEIVGTFIGINRSYWEIIGILSEIEYKPDEKRRIPVNPNRYNNSILVPYDTAFDKIETPPIYTEIDGAAIETGAIENTLRYKNIIEPALTSMHEKVSDFKIIAPLELLTQQQETQRVFNVVLLSIAAISLLVGGIGIMNIMLANILERVKEIGIRRAVGATKRDILIQFLSETVCITVIGGIMGIILGVLISFAVSKYADISVSYSCKPMILSFVISIATGVLFGMMPARRAANIDPIEALRKE